MTKARRQVNKNKVFLCAFYSFIRSPPKTPFGNSSNWQTVSTYWLDLVFEYLESAGLKSISNFFFLRTPNNFCTIIRVASDNILLATYSLARIRQYRHMSLKQNECSELLNVMNNIDLKSIYTFVGRVFNRRNRHGSFMFVGGGFCKIHVCVNYIQFMVLSIECFAITETALIVVYVFRVSNFFLYDTGLQWPMKS
ncbi:hypothetical protein BDC45DRAFT_559636 [Circinella umbellata]|nr:hypothetical protein BDC45DRAFT_538540 [Circinella umbellata]KAI7851179.1 hypothetical protein BDC45DRAFT_559636 [Circinella umbellata]